MTEEEWNAMGLSMGLVPDDKGVLLNIIDTEGEPNVLNEIDFDNNNVHHPKHYGGKDNPYEAIKIIEAYNMDFKTGNVIKYLLRYKDKNGIEDLWKAHWYLTRLIKEQEEQI
jgi:hypothetical protein